MSPAARRVVFSLGAAGIALIFFFGVAGLPPFGHYRGPYGDVVNRRAIPERHATNSVAAVVFDYRGWDTIGEEFILFAAVIGVAVLLRAQREERERRPATPEREQVSVPVRLVSAGLIAPIAAVGLYLVATGHLTPGGGFQGGAMVAVAFMLIYLEGKDRAFRRLSSEDHLEPVEGAAAGGLMIIGLIGIGTAFLHNFIDLGRTGNVFSAGTLPLLNLSTSLAVAAAILLIVAEVVHQLTEVGRR
jgi:multicomponent Na+:H+ antiporter subunit B